MGSDMSSSVAARSRSIHRIGTCAAEHDGSVAPVGLDFLRGDVPRQSSQGCALFFHALSVPGREARRDYQAQRGWPSPLAPGLL